MALRRFSLRAPDRFFLVVPCPPDWPLGWWGPSQDLLALDHLLSCRSIVATKRLAAQSPWPHGLPVRWRASRPRPTDRRSSSRTSESSCAAYPSSQARSHTPLQSSCARPVHNSAHTKRPYNPLSRERPSGYLAGCRICHTCFPGWEQQSVVPEGYPGSNWLTGSQHQVNSTPGTRTVRRKSINDKAQAHSFSWAGGGPTGPCRTG